MDVTSVRVYPMQEDGDNELMAFASIVLDEEFVVHNLRLVKANSGLIVAMPNEYSNGEFRDIAHPITNDCRCRIRDEVVEKYNKTVDEPYQVELTQ